MTTTDTQGRYCSDDRQKELDRSRVRLADLPEGTVRECARLRIEDAARELSGTPTAAEIDEVVRNLDESLPMGLEEALEAGVCLNFETLAQDVQVLMGEVIVLRVKVATLEAGRTEGSNT